MQDVAKRPKIIKTLNIVELIFPKEKKTETKLKSFEMRKKASSLRDFGSEGTKREEGTIYK